MNHIQLQNLNTSDKSNEIMFCTQIMLLPDNLYEQYFDSINSPLPQSILKHKFQQYVNKILLIQQKSSHNKIKNSFYTSAANYINQITQNQITSPRMLCKHIDQIQDETFWQQISQQINASVEELKDYYYKDFTRQFESYNLSQEDKKRLQELNTRYINHSPSSIADNFLRHYKCTEKVPKHNVTMFIIHLRRKTQ
ncbi:Hypothetical_protein [Hexamita inflata]|uniref:Hypothetical_protein n=1 Tax=Hexamita inflata TaxID=28002 RepID=A0AA86Q6E3_9EUKA|nr:Hypothetical protein HINF_LOCUS34567 [Hexamita inflata]